jgi:hypothetical protein
VRCDPLAHPARAAVASPVASHPVREQLHGAQKRLLRAGMHRDGAHEGHVYTRLRKLAPRPPVYPVITTNNASTSGRPTLPPFKQSLLNSLAGVPNTPILHMKPTRTPSPVSRKHHALHHHACMSWEKDVKYHTCLGLAAHVCERYISPSIGRSACSTGPSRCTSPPHTQHSTVCWAALSFTPGPLLA